MSLLTALATLGVYVLTPLLLVSLYILHNDARLKALPKRAEALSPERWTPANVQKRAAVLTDQPPISLCDQLPPRTGRRYIVVGGTGFLGGWIVNQLLERGEDPQNIRLLDFKPPVRHDLLDGIARGMQFIKVDVTDSKAVESAFCAPWPASSTIKSKPNSPQVHPELTVFHTAANIRFWERHVSLLPYSTNVNLAGTQNVVAAAHSAGAGILIYTSSASVAIRNSRFWLWPWEKEPNYFVQVIKDEQDGLLPKAHAEFFSNYAVSKMMAEKFVRAADKSPSGPDASNTKNSAKAKATMGIGSGKRLRTGCIRPGNGVYGPRGDMLCGAYLLRGTNPSWIHTVMQSFVYVENCALAHLLYERCLIDTETSTIHNLDKSEPKNPDIGGQAFFIADPGPAPTYGDVYTALETLTDGQTTFPAFSPTFLLIVSHLIEAYYVGRHHFLHSDLWTRWLGWWPALASGKFLPAVGGDLVNLQPSLFGLTMVHAVFDDGKARLPVEKGGLGYRGAWDTFEGVWKTVEEFKSGRDRWDQRVGGAGIGLSLGIGKGEKANSI